MIAIPNMSKPKECKECQWHLDFYIEDEQVGGLCTITEKDDRENTCPLIDIVTCGECIHFHYDKPYIIQGIPVLGHEVCDFWGDGCKTNPNGFCSYGERRSE
jgi:hypothetical protein